MMQEGTTNFDDLPEEPERTAREQFVERWQCKEGQRHAFWPFETFCLCGVLERGGSEAQPIVFSIWPAKVLELRALLKEPHHLGYPISGKTGQYEATSVMVRRDWYDRLIALASDG